MERLLARLPAALQPPRLPGTNAIDYRTLLQQALALALAIARHPLVFWPTVLLVGTWLVIEVRFCWCRGRCVGGGAIRSRWGHGTHSGLFEFLN